MLCLAGLGYRGSWDAGEAVVTGCLERLAPLHEGWDLVWGPAAYHAPMRFFDDALVFALRCRVDPSRYVVVVRGANPASVFDGLLGDLWAGRQVPWPFGDGRERVSLSVALALALLVRLRSDGPRSAGTARLWEGLDGRAATSSTPSPGLGPAAAVGRASLEGVRRTLLAMLGELGDGHCRAGGGVGARLEALAAAWASTARRQLFLFVDDVLHLLGDRPAVALLTLLEDERRLHNALGPGVDLPSFLAAAVAGAAGEVDVVITGYGKGGALASTIALWLAETQGPGARTAERWDPERKATLRCFSYAAPTAGNAAFAARSDRLIGRRCRRITNPLDIVPHAWAAATLRRIPELYGGAGRRIPAVAELVERIAAEVEPLGYAHVGTQVTELAAVVDPERPLFLEQLEHQHVDAYAQALGLDPQLVRGVLSSPAA